MKLHLLTAMRDKFKSYVDSPQYDSEIFKWECLDHFHEKWEIEAVDFGKMYDQSLSNQESGSLWGGNHQSPKSVMLRFIKSNPEFVRSMFKDLFSEKKDLMMRIERFQFHCDQLLDELRRSDRKLNYHYHHDFYMPTLYLALHCPLKYCLYNEEAFGIVLKKLEAKDSNYITLDRFLKVTKICQAQLVLDQDILALLKGKVQLINTELYGSMWLSYEFYQFISKVSL